MLPSCSTPLRYVSVAGRDAPEFHRTGTVRGVTGEVVLGIDAGTTGVRTYAIDRDSHVVRSDYREFPQYFPQPGWVEHDAEELWAATLATLTTVADACAAAGETDRKSVV